MVADFPISAKLTQPKGQHSQEATMKNFNSANLILMSIGKSGFIKFEYSIRIPSNLGFIVSDLMQRFLNRWMVH